MIWGIVNSQPSATSSGLSRNNTTVDVTLPRLTRIDITNNSPNATNRGIAASTRSATGFLDVVRDFYWTYSKPESREEVPTIYLKEKRLKVNALVSQLKYSLGFVASEARQAIEKVKQVGINLGFADWFVDAVGAVGSAGVATGQSIATEIEKLLENTTDNNSTLANSAWLQPYRGLYITEPTSWEFLFPYFEDKFEVQGNMFSSEGTTNALGGIAQGLGNLTMEIAEIAGSIANPTQITYIERAKFFNFPTDGEEVTFSFPLINTGSVTYSDVVNNWQLIFLLLYNNKPGRLSPTQIEQPVIYEVEIPGVKFLPFCYISSIDIKFQGARRELPIEIPFSEQQPGTNSAGDVVSVTNITSTKTINTIVPDAYMVTITLKSMLGNTKNFMYHLIDNGDRTKVGIR